MSQWQSHFQNILCFKIYPETICDSRSSSGYLSLVAKKDWEGFAITFVTRHNDDLKNLQQTSRSVWVSVPRAS